MSRKSNIISLFSWWSKNEKIKTWYWICVWRKLLWKWHIRCQLSKLYFVRPGFKSNSNMEYMVKMLAPIVSNIYFVFIGIYWTHLQYIDKNNNDFRFHDKNTILFWFVYQLKPYLYTHLNAQCAISQRKTTARAHIHIEL